MPRMLFSLLSFARCASIRIIFYHFDVLCKSYLNCYMSFSWYIRGWFLLAAVLGQCLSLGNGPRFNFRRGLQNMAFSNHVPFSLLIINLTFLEICMSRKLQKTLRRRVKSSVHFGSAWWTMAQSLSLEEVVPYSGNIYGMMVRLTVIHTGMGPLKIIDRTKKEVSQILYLTSFFVLVT